MKKNYLITTAGKFHHFEVAKVMFDNNQLSKIVSGNPWFTLKKEKIPKNLVEAHGILRILREPLIRKNFLKKLDDILNIWSAKNLDRITSKCIDENKDINVLIGQSKCALNSGKRIKSNGKIYICDRTSTHIVYQNNILTEEYESLGLKFKQIDKWYIDREIKEYDCADLILVPSNFVKSTFSENYLSKIRVLEFGVNINNFFRNEKIEKSKKYFDILFLAQKSIRKGLHYALEAFNKFKHPHKRLHIIGSDTSDKYFFKNKINDDKIINYGHIEHSKLNDLINFCHVYVLPSIEDGFATSVLQVASAGCPVIVTENTGSGDFVRKSNCGFVVPIRNSVSIVEKLNNLAENLQLLEQLSMNGQDYLKEHNWNTYVKNLELIINEFLKNNKI